MRLVFQLPISVGKGIRNPNRLGKAQFDSLSLQEKVGMTVNASCLSATYLSRERAFTIPIDWGKIGLTPSPCGRGLG